MVSDAMRHAVGGPVLTALDNSVNQKLANGAARLNCLGDRPEKNHKTIQVIM